MESSPRRSNGVEGGGKKPLQAIAFGFLKVIKETATKAAPLLIFKTGMGNDVLLTLPLGSVHPLAVTIQDNFQGRFLLNITIIIIVVKPAVYGISNTAQKRRWII